MDKDVSHNSDQNISRSSEENEVDKSFVGKVKSRVSGLFNSSSLSKWFNNSEDKKSVIRRRESFEEENDPCSFQPPTKRVKIPSSEQHDLNGVYINSENSARTICQPQLRTLTASSDDNHLKVFNNFAEPVPGPSGVKSRKLLNVPVSVNLLKNHEDAANEEKDSDSGGGSTSGYSSTVKLGGKEQGTHNAGPVIFQSTPFHNKSLFNSTAANNTCSLFAESSLSPQLNSSLSSRRPSFDASAFGSPNFVDKTLSTKRIIESPFYKGHTIYGGASAYGRRASRGVSEMKAAVNKSISIKPKNEIKNIENNPLSKTAQRILSTLEQYSTPVRDAKKIPVANKRQEGILSKYIGAKPYMIRERSKVPSATQLQVPNVPELLKMKERLQESTFNVRQIATSSKSSLNKESIYELKATEDEQSKHTNKLKNKMTSVRQKKTLESAKEVNLPNVSLPITNLPTFNFVIPPPSTESKKMKNVFQNESSSESSNMFVTKPKTTSNPGESIKFAHPICESEKTDKPKSVQNENGENVEFKFSKPVVIAENLKSIVGINNFRFSKPLPRRRAQEDSITATSIEKSESETIIATDYGVIKNNAKIKATELLKSDLLKNSDSLMMKFKPAEGTWECPECLIRNNPDTEKCAACKSTKPNSDDKKAMSAHNDKLKCPFCASHLNSSDEGSCTSCLNKTGNCKPILQAASKSQSTKSFEGVYKTPTDTWECPTCMIRNKESLNKCEACETAKPVSKLFVSAFTKKAGEWECEACMVNNSSDKIKCVCCDTPKPDDGTSKTSFAFVVPKKEGEWECEACMVKNSPEKLKCVCCETPKPGVTLAEPKSSKMDSSFHFGVDKTAISGFKFGIPQPVSTTLETSTTTTSSVASPTVKFSFGTPKAASPSVTSAPVDFAFGTSKAVSPSVTSPTVKFAFGAPKAAVSQQTSNLEQPKGFVFGSSESTCSATATAKSDAVITTSSTFSIAQAPATITSNFTTSTDFKFGSGASTTVGQMNPPNESLVTTKTQESKPALMFNSPKSQLIQPQFKPTTVNGEIPNVSKNIFGNVTPITLQTNKPIIPVSTSQASLSFEVKTPAALSTSQAPVVSTKESSAPVARPVFKFGASPVASMTPSTSNSTIFNSSSNVMPVKNDFASAAAASLQSRKHSADDSGPYKKKPMYSFGSSDKPVEASKPVPFSFAPPQTNSGTGGSFSFSPPAAPSGGGFSLKPNSNSTEKSSSATTNLFDGSVQPVVKNGGFNFGTTSNNASQKAGFSFAAATPVAPSNQPGFNFGAPAPQSSSGGFSFAAPNLSKPSFNFTGSSEIPTFTAQPSSEIGGHPRKIKRAIRRVPPR